MRNIQLNRMCNKTNTQQFKSGINEPTSFLGWRNLRKIKNRLLILGLLLVHFSLVGQKVDAGNGHAIILNKDGAVFTVGRNDYGQLGDGSLNNSSKPIYVQSLPNIQVISRGYDHSLAIDSAGNVWAWGRNNFGQLGTGDIKGVLYPRKMSNHSSFISVEGGYWHSVGLKKNGTVMAWGHNKYGELGNKTTEHSQNPVIVIKENGNPLSNIVDIASVGNFTLALDKFGDVYSWGANDVGELGHFDHYYQPFAKKIDSLSNIQAIAAGWHHSVALNNNGEVFIWGSDPAFQFNENTSKFYKEIIKVKDLPQIKTIACGSWHSLAIDMNNEVWGWGKNHYGMLGTGDTLSSTTPRKIKFPNGICEIGGGCFQSLAVDSAGTIYSMGNNPSGQQGQGHLTRLLNPEQLILPSIPEGKPFAKEAMAAKNSIIQEGDNSNLGYYLMKTLKYTALIISILLNFYFYRSLTKMKNAKPRQNT